MTTVTFTRSLLSKRRFSHPSAGRAIVLLVLVTAGLVQAGRARGQAVNEHSPVPPAVIGYYAGRITEIDSFEIGKLTHIIFSFCHLKGNRLNVDRAMDTALIQRMVALKSSYPRLKVILSLGGWGGCKTCPDVFATRRGRKQFSRSVKEISDYFHTDGLDLDWEYPALSNVPGYAYYPEDVAHFSALIKKLRNKLGNDFELSFAAGGFTKALAESIDWKKVMPLVNRVNLMTYDLVSGYDTITGHHTPLYSTPFQLESTDHAIRYLDSIGVPRNKMVIGMAFYARIWENVDSLNDGIYRQGKFFRGVSYRNQSTILSPDSGFVYHWDPIARAPFMYNASRRQYVTFDDPRSIQLKTQYAIDEQLNGVMFWQLAEDKYKDGLLEVIDETVKGAKK